MNSPESGLALNLTQDYLEVARAAQAILGPSDESLAGRHGHPGLHNAVFTVMTLNLLYSYLALDAFLAQGLAEADEPDLGGGLEERTRHLCTLWDLPWVDEVDPRLAGGLRTLEADADVLLPGGAEAGEGRIAATRALMEREHPLPYASVAEDVLKHLHRGRADEAPRWLQRNVLLDLRAMLAD